MFRGFKFTIGRKIYALIALGFVGLLGITVMNSLEVASSLRQQKVVELKHLVDMAVGIVKDEHAASERGELSAADAQKRAARRISVLRYGNNDYFWINDMHPKIVMHPLRAGDVGRDMSESKDANGKPLYRSFVETVRTSGAGLVEYDQIKPGIKEPQPKLSYVAGFAPWNWVIGTGVYIDDLEAQTWISTQRALIAAAAVMVMMLGVSIVMAGRISKPLRRITGTMTELAHGKLDVEVPGLGRRDEIGDMAEALEVFKSNAAERATLETERRAAEQRSAEQSRAAVRRIADEFEATIGDVVDTVSTASTELESAAGSLIHNAEATQKLSADVVSVSELASMNVQSVASATAEMTSSVNEIDRQVQDSTRIAARAVEQAEKTDARIADLSQAASRIGEVVKLITAIAEQTNLLALNATIEAARAGEAGKGFAVVAQEVKALAAQTAKATGEISAQISGMQAATQESVAAIKEISGTIAHISEISTAIAAAVEEQGAATSEVARNIQEASRGTSRVATNIAEVSRGANETEIASEQVKSSAAMLAREGGKLKSEVRRFLEGVRSGAA